MGPAEAGRTRLDRVLDRLYARRSSATDHWVRLRTWGVICAAFLRRYIPTDSVVLDVGAGHCEFINQVAAHRRIAVDLNPETARRAAPGVEVHSIPLEKIGEVIEPGSVDLAFASNVFEHMQGPDTLLEALEAIYEVVKPGGLLIVMQPNARLVGGRFWDFLDHTLPLTERGMIEALEVSRFEVLESRARFLPYTFRSRLPTWPWLVRLYLRFPPARWAFGRQMFLVARRPR